MTKQHDYEVAVRWTGDLGRGTADYRAYSRDHELSAPGKAPIGGSSDPAFRGDPARYNPEDLLVGALSACHMLWYLHLCAEAGVVVKGYVDAAHGSMDEHADGSGEFRRVVLRPHVTVAAGSDVETAKRLHEEVHRFCCLARSVNFEVACEPTLEVGEAGEAV
jgi:organic hydroperoxide reductase OsmC/OhrA